MPGIAFFCSGGPPGALRRDRTSTARVARNMPAAGVAIRATDAGALIDALAHMLWYGLGRPVITPKIGNWWFSCCLDGVLYSG